MKPLPIIGDGRNETKLGDLPKHRQIAICQGIADFLSALYSGGKVIDVQICDDENELTVRGNVWMMQLQSVNTNALKDWRDLIDQGRIRMPDWYPNIQEIRKSIADAEEIAGYDRPQVKIPAESGPSNGWRDRMVMEERQRHPDWERLTGEPSKEYGSRMLKVMAKLSAEFDEKRIVRPS